jgi:hypothetical protein
MKDILGMARFTAVLSGLLVSSACDVTQPLTNPENWHWIASSSGRAHACALSADGRLACWGANDRYQLGTGDSTDRETPSLVQSPILFRAVSAGGRHTCAIDLEQNLWCWGANHSGQLGDGTSDDRGEPVKVIVRGPFSQVSAGEEHTCTVRITGEGFCWGANQAGQLGNSNFSDGAFLPSPVFGGLSFDAISSGHTHSCGLTNAGIAYCWGGNKTGKLGTGTLISSASPVIVSSWWHPFQGLQAGDTHSCGLDVQGRGWCWGGNNFGEVENNSSVIRGSPVLRSDDSLLDIGVGEKWTCALFVQGDVRCWGVRWDSMSGAGSHPISREGWAPALSPSDKPVALSVGTRHACVITDKGNLVCWGRYPCATKGLSACLG